MRNRLYNYFRARYGGYFWLPCPLCGQNFGGHEWEDGPLGESSIIWISGDGEDVRHGQGICPDCTLKGLGDA